jgi:lipid A 3-O-deacylase
MSKLLVPLAALCCLAALPARAQSSPRAQSIGHMASGSEAPAAAALATDPWEYGVFFGGGFGVGDRSSFSFTNAGVRLGKVLTDQHLPWLLRGQFEYAAEFMPYWQSFTPAAGLRPTKVYDSDGAVSTEELPYDGGTFTGLSITPIMLRWDLKPTRRLSPYLQGAGGLIWTNHKYPPDVIPVKGAPGGTSVWNFTPQFGIGVHYFMKDRQAIDLQASAVHISSASLGDRNPGVNASVQFQIGYSWWK